MTRVDLKKLVAQELLDRDQARKSVSKLYTRLYPHFTLAPFHYEVAKELDGFIHGSVKRLIINMPPGHLKSYLASQLAPA